MRKTVNRCIVIMALIARAMLIPTESSAQLNWRYEIGGMYTSRPTNLYTNAPLREDQESWYNLGTGLFLQIPLQNNENPFFIETGLNLLVKPGFSLYEGAEKPYMGYDVYNDDVCALLQLPVKFGWRKHLKGSNWVEFGLGPYVSYNFIDLGYKRMQVGLNPSVVFRHRCVSVGISYHNPTFYNGTHDHMRNTVMLSFGLNFGNKAWKWIGVGALTAASLGSAVGAVYGAANGGSSYKNYSSYNVGSSYGSSDNYSSSKSSNSNNDNVLSTRGARNTDKATYERYDSQLAQYFSGNRSASTTEIKEIQRKMRALREKWEARGDGWTKVANETKSVAGD